MNKEEIEKARKKREELILKRENLVNDRKEYQELLLNPYVKRYLELSGAINRQIYNDQQINRLAFSESRKEKSNIFIYMGAYKYDKSCDARNDIKTDDIEYADYLLYQDLENELNCHYIKPRYQQIFEQDKIVIKLSDYCTKRSEYYYYMLQDKYFGYLLEGYTTDIIVKKLTKEKPVDISRL